jgi:hypothetical protein
VLLGGLWTLAHKSFDRKVTGSAASEPAAALAPSGPSTPSSEPIQSDIAALPESMPLAQGSPLAVPAVQTAAAPASEPAVSESPGHGIAPSAARRAAADEISFSADTYQVRTDEHFAEINVHRAGDSRVTNSFEWWTEGASARPGSDFVAQKRTTQSFPNGRHWTKLFIRIVPNAAHTRTQTFYVYMTEPSTAQRPGAVTRAAILIPPPSTGQDVPPIQSAQRQP